uniref:Envelope fusion protein n=1 Tax=Cacopsylla melanoneura TaxID=428564 RepID=A0A8D8X3W9_9HEMI
MELSLYYCLLTTLASTMAFPFFVEKDRSITIAHTSWLTVYSLNLDSFRYDIAQINNTLTLLRNKISKVHSTNHSEHLIGKLKEELSLLESEVSKYNEQIDNLLNLSPESTRSRRGLINAVGTLSKYLFGTADDDDRQQIFTKLNMLDKSNDMILNTNEAQIQVLTHLDHRISNNSKVINEVITKAKALTSLLISYNITNQNSEIQTIYQFLFTQSTLRELLLLLGDLKFSILEFTQALQQSNTNHLSYNLINPTTLIKNLAQIKNKAPPHLTLPYPITADSIHQYYSIISVHTLKVDNQIKIVLRTPMIYKGDQTYTIHKIYTIPVFNTHLDKWISYKPLENIIAINNKTQLYFTTTDSSLRQECGTSEICSLDEIILHTFNHHTCELSITLNDTKHIYKLCTREIFSTDYDLSVIKTKTGWLYSTKRPINYTLDCPRRPNTRSISTHTLEKVGFIKIDVGCTLRTSDLFLLATDTPGFIDANLTYLNTLSPSHIITQDEHLALSEDLNITLNVFNYLQSSDQSDALQLTTLLEQVRQAKREKLILEASKYGGTGIVMSIIIITSVICVIKCFSKNTTKKELTVMLQTAPSTANLTSSV